MERYRLLEGVVVGRKALPPGDLLLRLVTPEGSLEALARRGQRPTGRTGRLALFHQVRFQVYGKGEGLPILTQAELLARFPGLEAPRRFFLAGFLAELAFLLASPEAAPKVYPLLLSGLRGIARHEEPLLPLVWAGWRLLGAGGLAPDLRGPGTRLKGGVLGEEGVELGTLGREALRAILQRPGKEALTLLEKAPLERLYQALKAHAGETLGPLKASL